MRATKVVLSFFAAMLFGLTGCGGGGSTPTFNNTSTEQSADISGFWEFQTPASAIMNLTQNGTTVSGSFVPGATPTISGSVTGNNLNLLFNDEGCVNTLTGTVSGNTMSGTVTLTIDPGLGSCSATPGTEPWSATRTTDPTTTFSISGTVTSSGTGLASVTMNLSGASSGSVNTDASGNYSFGNLANGSYIVTPSKTGYTFSPSSSDTAVNGANVTGVNYVTVNDTPQPAQTADISGYWEFQPTGSGSMSLTQSNTTVSGTLSFGSPPTISGSVAGNNVSLLFHDEGCINELTGTVSGNTMSGNVTVTIDSSLGSCSATPGTEPWSATRTTAP